MYNKTYNTATLMSKIQLKHWFTSIMNPSRGAINLLIPLVNDSQNIKKQALKRKNETKATV